MSTLPRREFMGSLLGGAAFGGLHSSATFARLADLPPPSGRDLLVVYRAERADSAAFAQTLAAAGCATRVLAVDIVRQWRDGLGPELLAGHRLMLGLGTWDDQILLQGLAAEQGQRPLLLLQHPLQRQLAGWASDHAQELLHALQAGSPARDAALAALAQRHALQPETPALFSWVIA